MFRGASPNTGYDIPDARSIKRLKSLDAGHLSRCNRWHFNLRSPSDFLLVYIHRCVKKRSKAFTKELRYFYKIPVRNMEGFFFKQDFLEATSNFYLGSHKRIYPPNPQAQQLGRASTRSMPFLGVLFCAHHSFS